MTPQLNQPVLLATKVNGRWEIIEDTWKGNLPYDHQIITPQQAKQYAQENISNLQADIDRHGKNGFSRNNKDQAAMVAQVQQWQSGLSKWDNYQPPAVNGLKYVIGPNGQIMTEANAANFISPEEGLRQAEAKAGKTQAQIDAENTANQARGGVDQTAPLGQATPQNNAVSTGVLGGGSSTFIDNSSATPIQHPTINLQPGDTGAEVKKLQDYLVSKGLMTQAQVDTGYGTYGPQTTAAVAALQKSLGVDNSTGVGYFGPRTVAALGGTSDGTSGGAEGTSAATVDPGLLEILNNPTLSPDQKAAIQSIFNAVSTNDADTAAKLQAAMKAASEFSDPYFKAQIRLATDALQRGLSGKEGDLAFAEAQQKSALDELRANTAASKENLSFEHAQELKNLETKYTTDLQTTQDNLAATGFTSSSKRARAEQILGEQNQGLVESSNKTFSYQTGNLNRNLTTNEAQTQAQIANLQRLASEGKLDLLRQGEQQVGTKNLANLGFTGLLGDVGGQIPRQQVTDSLNFASGFVF